MLSRTSLPTHQLKQKKSQSNLGNILSCLPSSVSLPNCKHHRKHCCPSLLWCRIPGFNSKYVRHHGEWDSGSRFGRRWHAVCSGWYLNTNGVHHIYTILTTPRTSQLHGRRANGGRLAGNDGISMCSEGKTGTSRTITQHPHEHCRLLKAFDEYCVSFWQDLRRRLVIICVVFSQNLRKDRSRDLEVVYFEFG